MRTNEEIFRPFIKYFERQWMGQFMRVRRGGNDVKIIWNQFNYLEEDIMRNTSSIEIWHKKFFRLLNRFKSSFEEFFEVIQEEQNTTEILYNEYKINIDTIKKNKKKLKKFEKLKLKALEKYSNIN